MHKCPGVDYSTGSLGQGLSVGVGIALGAMLKKRTFRTVVLLGDGECQEGQVWEAAMFAGTRRVRRLIAIVDANGVQLSSKVDEGVSLEPQDKKWEAFNWRALTVDGHDLSALRDTLRRAAEAAEQGPVAVIARTVKGKGVSFMENRFEWHGKAPDDAELAWPSQSSKTKGAGHEARRADRGTHGLRSGARGRGDKGRAGPGPGCRRRPIDQTHFFAKRFPERFIQVGIAEQNMAGIAAGLSTLGFIPWISAFAVFLTKRSGDQVATASPTRAPT